MRGVLVLVSVLVLEFSDFDSTVYKSISHAWYRGTNRSRSITLVTLVTLTPVQEVIRPPSLPASQLSPLSSIYAHGSYVGPFCEEVFHRGSGGDREIGLERGTQILRKNIHGRAAPSVLRNATVLTPKRANDIVYVLMFLLYIFFVFSPT